MLKWLSGIVLVPYTFFNILYYVSLNFVGYFVFVYMLYIVLLFGLFIKTQYVLMYFRAYDYQKKRIF